jgi:hypothetical protein
VPLGVRDLHGRQLVLCNLGLIDYSKGLANADLVRAVWYMLHAAFEERRDAGSGGGEESTRRSSCGTSEKGRGRNNSGGGGGGGGVGVGRSTSQAVEVESEAAAQEAAVQAEAAHAASVTQRLGIFVLLNMQGFARKQLSTEAVQLVGRALQGALPVRVAAVRIVNQPWFFGFAWAAAAPILLKEKLRRRVLALAGDAGMLRMWLPGNSAPADVDLEGNFGWDHAQWLARRLEKDHTEIASR